MLLSNESKQIRRIKKFFVEVTASKYQKSLHERGSVLYLVRWTVSTCTIHTNQLCSDEGTVPTRYLCVKPQLVILLDTFEINSTVENIIGSRKVQRLVKNTIQLSRIVKLRRNPVKLFQEDNQIQESQIKKGVMMACINFEESRDILSNCRLFWVSGRFDVTPSIW